MRHRVFVHALLAAAAIGCSGDAGGPSVNLTGDWLGGASAQLVTITIRFSLTESGNGLNGTGTLSGTGLPTCTAVVSGSKNGTAVTLQFACAQFAPLNFSGSSNTEGTRISGTLSGSGFSPLGIAFIKQ